MSTAAPVKFTFDLDLGRREEKNRVLTDTAVAAMIEEARAEGFAEGRAAGEQSASAKAAKQLANAAAAMGQQVAALSAGIEDMRRTTVQEAVELAATIARKLASGLVDQQPLGEIEALIVECLSSLNGVPHLVIRCEPTLADAVRDIATERIGVSGFSGRLVVMGEPEIGRGDCRIEWVDGGLVRDHAKLTAEIDSRIAAYLAERGIKHDAAGVEESE